MADEPYSIDPDVRAAQRAARDRAKLAETLIAQDDIRLLMAEPWGRRIAFKLIETTGPFRLSFDAESATRTAFNEGSRNVGLWFLGLLKPDEYAQMMQENTDVR